MVRLVVVIDCTPTQENFVRTLLNQIGASPAKHTGEDQD
jgi:hypothetical protein